MEESLDFPMMCNLNKIICNNQYMSPVMRKPVLPYVNNKGTEQPQHPRSLIRGFVVCFLDSMILLSFYIKNFKALASLCCLADPLESKLVANPEDRFSHDEAHILTQLN